MPNLEQLQQLATAKRQECLALSRAYHSSLSALSPANLLLVVGAALLYFTAGTAILMDGAFITKTEAGLLAFLSGALTVIHSKLGPDNVERSDGGGDQERDVAAVWMGIQTREESRVIGRRCWQSSY